MDCCINPFLPFLAFFPGFLSWGYMTLFRVKLFPKLREEDKVLYTEIVGNRDGWLDRGWYSPSDLPVVLRLHRAIRSGAVSLKVAGVRVRAYNIATFIFIVAAILFAFGETAVFYTCFVPQECLF